MKVNKETVDGNRKGAEKLIKYLLTCRLPFLTKAVGKNVLTW